MNNLWTWTWPSDAATMYKQYFFLLGKTAFFYITFLSCCVFLNWASNLAPLSTSLWIFQPTSMGTGSHG